MTAVGERAARIRGVVGAVARQMLRDRAASRVALLDDGSPEARLAGDWLAAELGAERVWRVRPGDEELESVLQSLRGAPDAAAWSARRGMREEGMREEGERERMELGRIIARLAGDAVIANPLNKTALLLGGEPPPDALLPLGDLYASQVLELAGGWSAPAAVRALADRCGGVRALDEAMQRRLEGRETAALQALGPAATDVAAALARGRPARVLGTVVPKLGSRTYGVDLFE